MSGFCFLPHILGVWGALPYLPQALLARALKEDVVFPYVNSHPNVEEAMQREDKGAAELGALSVPLVSPR